MNALLWLFSYKGLEIFVKGVNKQLNAGFVEGFGVVCYWGVWYCLAIRVKGIKMKYITLIALLSFIPKVISGEPVYLISDDSIKSNVIAVFGYPNNKKPCESLKEFANQEMISEKLSRKFHCAKFTEAINVTCDEWVLEYDGKGELERCRRNFTTRHLLLKDLMGNRGESVDESNDSN